MPRCDAIGICGGAPVAECIPLFTFAGRIVICGMLAGRIGSRV